METNYISLDSSTINPEELNKVQFDTEWIDPDSSVSMMFKEIRKKGIEFV